jgi:hypothetical protein
MAAGRRRNVNAADNWGETPLHYAASRSQKSVVKLLLANKADVNAADTNGETPLYKAAVRSHKDVVKLLLASKAEVNARDKSGRTPLSRAAQDSHKDVLELLRQHGGVESEAPPDVARLKQALLGDWAVDQEATADSMARGKLGPQSTVTVSRREDSPAIIRTNFTNKQFNQQEYEQAKRILLESFRANDHHTWMTFAPDGTGTESELGDSGTRSNMVHFSGAYRAPH